MSTENKNIRVAIVGVGNCAKSLIEGVVQYTMTDSAEGLAFESIGGYKASDIQFVLAYDVDTRKAGHYLTEAIYAKPNCAIDLIDVTDPDTEEVLRQKAGYVPVQMGRILDGIGSHMADYPEDESFRVSTINEATLDEVVASLLSRKVDVLLNYLPVGSEEATRFYVEACLIAGVPFVNCIPVFIVSDPNYEQRLIARGIPAIGDDMRSQLGASVLSQAIQELFFNRGMTVQFHSQTNQGGNTDFLNMVDQSRLKNKRISKENVIRSQNDIRGIPVPKNGIYAGPAAYIPFLGDTKVAHFRIEAEGFGDNKITLDARLQVNDSPNSAGVVIDAVRYLKVAHEMGLVGSLRGPSASTQKTPIEQLMIQDAYDECKALAERRLTDRIIMHNVVKP